jgi:hypothetical protein
LVRRIFTDCVQESDDALIQLNLVIVSEVNNHCVVNSFSALKLRVRRKLFYIHHVSQTEKRVNVDAGLQVFAQSHGVLDEFDGIHLN